MGSADFPIDPALAKGRPLPAALKRLHAIQPDPTAARAPRDAMLAQFEGLDQWIPRPIREALSTAVNDELITLERMVLAAGARPVPCAGPAEPGRRISDPAPQRALRSARELPIMREEDA
jgi:hypothetical protein